MSEQKYWLGPAPETCDVCGSKIGKVFYDAKHPPSRGMWGSLCQMCFTMDGGKLGTGYGQKYEKKGDKWPKTGG